MAKTKKAPRPNHEQYKKTKDGKCEYGLTAPRQGAQWSGHLNGMEIPARGEQVFVNMNGFGEGIVRGYFVEHDWLGVYVEPLVPPKWWLEQNAADPCQCCMVFGIEIMPSRVTA